MFAKPNEMHTRAMIQAGTLAQAFAEWRLLPHEHPAVLQGFPQQRTPEEAAARRLRRKGWKFWREGNF